MERDKYHRHNSSQQNAHHCAMSPVCSVLEPTLGQPVPVPVVAATAATLVYCLELPMQAGQLQKASETINDTQTTLVDLPTTVSQITKSFKICALP